MNHDETPKGLCSSCNRAVELDVKTCPHCGAPLTASDPDAAKLPTH